MNLGAHLLLQNLQNMAAEVSSLSIYPFRIKSGILTAAPPCALCPLPLPAPGLLSKPSQGPPFVALPQDFGLATPSAWSLVLSHHSYNQREQSLRQLLFLERITNQDVAS